eukprot:INCI16342.3.p1 GENE.INCI16342.3~~INCI16342.3.p1  ORF type:complete len:1979 (+),score=405.36 INCI16342.3:58-5937(+)
MAAAAAATTRTTTDSSASLLSTTDEFPSLADAVAAVDPQWLEENADFVDIVKRLKKCRAKDLRNQLEAKGLSADGLSKVLVTRLAVALYVEEFGIPSAPAKDRDLESQQADRELNDAPSSIDAQTASCAAGGENDTGVGEIGDGQDEGEEEVEEEVEEYFEEDLFRAVWEGDLELVYKCTAYRRALVQGVDKYGRSPLSIACDLGHVKIVHGLVGSSANMLHKAHNGMTPLHYAARNGYLEIAKYILFRRKQAIDKATELGITPLMEACSNGQLRVAEFLLQQQAFVNARAKDGCSALIATIQSQTSSAFRLTQILMRRTFRTAPVHSFVANTLDPLDDDPDQRRSLLSQPHPVLAELRATFESAVTEVESPWTPARINVSLRDGTSAIHFAARDADLYTLGLLLASKARVDTLDEMGVTPLVFAVETGDFECILALLAFGADPDIVPNDHRTPVFHAVETENTDALRLLLALKARADVILPENKASALHMAARKGFTPELTQILLEAGANPEHVLGGRFEAGSTALLIAAKHGNFEIVQHLVNFGANLEVPDTTKRTALYMAADKGYKDIVVALCVGGARINTQDRWKTTALHAAVKSKNVDVVEAMVDMGALVHTRNDFSPYHGATNSERATPIEHAIKTKRLDLLELLLKADDAVAAVNAADHLGNAPLHRAAQMGFKEAVELLLVAKAEVNSINGWHGAPLHSSLTRRQQKCAYQLLTAKADVTLVTQWAGLPTDFGTADRAPRGATALNMALKMEQWGVARDLLAIKADPDSALGNGATALHQCLDADQFEMAQLLLDSKADANLAEDDDGLAPIHLVIDSENSTMLRQLLLSRAEINQPMADGATALHIAAAKGSMKMLTMLIMKKADLDVCMNDGESAIALAFRTRNFSIVDELRGAGADPSQVDPDELDKWQMMYQSHYETKKRDASLEDENAKRPRCGQCEHCVRNIYHLQRYGRAGKLRCKHEKELILQRTHHRAYFGRNPETGELTGGREYFLWVENEINRKSATRALVYSGSLVSNDGNEEFDDGNPQQSKKKMDAEGKEVPVPPKTHTRDQLVRAFHARRKTLDATVKTSGAKLKDLMHQLQTKTTFFVRQLAGSDGGAGRDVEYTDSDLKHGVKQRMTKNQWQMQLLDTIEAEEQVYMAARNELQCLDAWVRGDVVVKLQRMRRQSRRNGRQLELWHNAIAAMKGHKQNVQTNRITAWYRGVVARRRVRKLKLVREYNAIHNAATLIQKIFRGRRVAALVPSFKESAKQHYLGKMATILQRRYWEYQAMLQQREWFLQKMSLKNAAKMARINHSATLIQKVVRGRIGRRKFFSIIGPRVLHGALRGPLEEYQDSGDIWKLLNKLNETYQQLDARNKHEDETSEMFVGSLLKWRTDYDGKLAEQNRQKSFREQELKKAREVLLDANLPNNPNVVMGGKKHRWTEKGPEWLQKQGETISQSTRKKKQKPRKETNDCSEKYSHRGPDHAHGPNESRNFSGDASDPAHEKTISEWDGDCENDAAGESDSDEDNVDAFNPQKGLKPIVIPASLDRVAPLDIYSPTYKKPEIKLGGWAKSTAQLAVSSPFDLESMDEPVSRLFLYACMKTYPPRLEGGLSFDAALEKWFREPPSLKKVRDEQILRERIKGYDRVLQQHNIRFIGDALHVDFSALGFPLELVENLDACLMVFKRRVKNKNANTVAASYTRVGKQYLVSDKSRSHRSTQSHGEKALSRPLLLDPKSSHEIAVVVNNVDEVEEVKLAENARKRQLQQRMEVLDELLQDRLDRHVISDEQAIALREKLAAQFRVPVLASSALSSTIRRPAVDTNGRILSGVETGGPKRRSANANASLTRHTSLALGHQPTHAIQTAEQWILKLDQEQGINLYHGMTSTEAAVLTRQSKFNDLKQRLLVSAHDQLLTYLVMRHHGNFLDHNPQNSLNILGFPGSQQFLSAFVALAAMRDDDADIGG